MAILIQFHHLSDLHAHQICSLYVTQAKNLSFSYSKCYSPLNSRNTHQSLWFCCTPNQTYEENNLKEGRICSTLHPPPSPPPAPHHSHSSSWAPLYLLNIEFSPFNYKRTVLPTLSMFQLQELPFTCNMYRLRPMPL